MTHLDLNADLGESFGPWQMGQDDAILPLITSANIACGLHAGDWDVMAETMAAAVAQGVGIGAHPGLPDLQGFGRREISLPDRSLGNLIRYQIGAAQAMARAAGGRLRHVKLHGALANMAARDARLARVCYEAALSVAPDLIVMVIAGTAQARAAQDLGARMASEIFADRAYLADATLMDRRLPGAVIHDAETAAARVLAMLRAGAILPESGDPIPVPIDTVCLHGDTPGALDLARHLRARLAAEGVTLRAF